MEIIFIYNANSGLVNALRDVAHKILSPSTYPCSLCALTYDTVTENRSWKKFRKTSSFEFVFLHKDEFEAKQPNLQYSYPVILKKKSNQLTILLSAKELNAIKNTEELITKLNLAI